MFIGRSEELKQLDRVYHEKKGALGIVYGRRRIGKTTLLKKFLEDHEGLYFVASEMSIAKNLEIFNALVKKQLNTPYELNDLVSIFSAIIDATEDRPYVVIIDEFTYLLQQDPKLASVFQYIVDELLPKSQLMLILSGSQMGMIEHELTYQRPLYGRARFQLKLMPMNYLEAAEFVPHYSWEDKIRTYAIFGGIPYYLDHLEPTQSLHENIQSLILEKGALLEHEVDYFLRFELRSIGVYQAILFAMASGATKINEIAQKASLETPSTVATYLRPLMELGIVTKEKPFGASLKSRKSLYKIDDAFFHFVYTFITPYQAQRELMSPHHFFQTLILPTFEKYVSLRFESLVKDYFRLKSMRGDRPLDAIDRYWGNDPVQKKSVEIDLVMRSSNTITVCEIKWRNKPFSQSDVAHLKHQSSSLSPSQYLGVSKSGFTKDALAVLDTALTLEDLYQ